MEENKFYTGQEVLVRDNSNEKWAFGLFSHIEDDEDEYPFIYYVAGSSHAECIPYEGNKELVGTTDSPKEDLPIDTPVMCKTKISAWELRYYSGDNTAFTGGLKSSSKIIKENPPHYLEDKWDIIIPVKDFDFENPENSLKYNLVK